MFEDRSKLVFFKDIFSNDSSSLCLLNLSTSDLYTNVIFDAYTL